MTGRPTGSGFVATTALGNGDNNWWVATLDAIDAHDRRGAQHRAAQDPAQLPAHLARRPDGRLYRRADERFRARSAATSGRCRSRAASRSTRPGRDKATVTSLTWTRGGLARDPADGRRRADRDLRAGQGHASRCGRSRSSFAAGDGRVAFSGDGSVRSRRWCSDYEHAPAIYAGPRGALRKITTDNDGVDRRW